MAGMQRTPRTPWAEGQLAGRAWETLPKRPGEGAGAVWRMRIPRAVFCRVWGGFRQEGPEPGAGRGVMVVVVGGLSHPAAGRQSSGWAPGPVWSQPRSAVRPHGGCRCAGGRKEGGVGAPRGHPRSRPGARRPALTSGAGFANGRRN